MHQLIRVLVWTHTADDAKAVAQNLLEDELSVYNGGSFDYGRTLDDDNARWREEFPEAATHGALLSTSDEGERLIRQGWNQTKNAYHVNITRALEAMDGDLQSDEVFENPMVRHHLSKAGAYDDTSLFLYDQWGCGVSCTSEYEAVLDGTNNRDDDAQLWVVPLDVHY